MSVRYINSKIDVIATHYFNKRYRIRDDFDLLVYLFRHNLKMKYILLAIENYPVDSISSCKTQKLKIIYRRSKNYFV